MSADIDVPFPDEGWVNTSEQRTQRKIWADIICEREKDGTDSM